MHTPSHLVSVHCSRVVMSAYGKAEHPSLPANGEDFTYALSCVRHIPLRHIGTYIYKLRNSESLRFCMF